MAHVGVETSAQLEIAAHMSPMRNAPIGIFDSGLGGLSVWHEIVQMMPAEDVLYLADSAYVPYGTRPRHEILNRSIAVAGYLVDQGVKLVVVACNTASAVAIDELREAYPDTTFVGLEPAVKPALGMSMTGRVGVLATPRTVSGDRLRVLIEHWADGVQVRTIAGNGMVELVEAGVLTGSEVDAVLAPILDPLLAEKCDVLVLGCTHYPFLRAAIQEYVGPAVRLIDSGHAIARRTLSLLQAAHMLHDRGEPGATTVNTTGNAAEAERVAQLLTGRELTVSHSDIPAS